MYRLDFIEITLMVSVKRRNSSVGCTILGWGTLIGAPAVLGCIGTVFWTRVTGGFLWRDDGKVVTDVTGIEEAVKKKCNNGILALLKRGEREMWKNMF